MVHPVAHSILRRLTPADGWVGVARIFVGLFFLSAALYKFGDFFLVGNQTITLHVQNWINIGWMPQWYQWIILHLLALPYGNITIEVLTILLQGIPAILLIVRKYTRVAGVLLLLVHLNILSALSLLPFGDELTGWAVWIALFFVCFPMSRRTWRLLTFVLIGLLFLHLYNRVTLADDQWPSSVAWHRIHLEQDIMSIHPLWKSMALAFSATIIGWAVWAAIWWVEVLLTFVLFTRWRLYGGAVLLGIFILKALTWMSAMTSHGVLMVLTLFLWTVHEERTRRLA